MRNAPRRRPSVECLEERGLLSTTGLAWPDPGHLTLSFAPDGTSVGGAPSALYRTLNSRLPNSWQPTVLRAFQSWAALANINIGVVSDDGQPFGQAGMPQGNRGAGDIRLAARPLGQATLALATPFDLFNSWSGDVVLNSDAPFGDGSVGTEDLFSAALHEAGHVFGLDDNPAAPSSALFSRNTAGRTGPSAADAALLQSLYGARAADARDNTFASATPLTYLETTGDLVSKPKEGKTTGILGELNGAADRDVFATTVPYNQGGPFAITLRASGMSLATPRITVFDALGQVVGTAVATDPLHNDLTVTIPASMPGSRFYARVEASGPGAGVFAFGSYRIAAGSPDVARAAASLTLPAGPTLNPDGARNDQVGKAINLKPLIDLNNPGWPYSVRAGIVRPTDADFYKFKTDKATSPVTLVTVWGLDTNGLTPRLDVLDKGGKPVPVQLISRNANSMTLQIPKTEAGAWYNVRVAALDPSAPHATGDYFLGVAFRDTAVASLPFADGVLDAAKTQDFRTLTVAASQLFHFDLSVSGGEGGSGGTAVRASIYDASKRLVTTFNTVNSTNGTVDVFLKPGVYTIRFVGGTKSGAPLPMLRYEFRGLVRSDPIGPSLVDTTQVPTTPTPPIVPPPTYTWAQDDYLNYTYYLTITDPGSLPF